MVLSALAMVMSAVPVCASAVSLTKARSTPCAARKVRNSFPKASVPRRPISVDAAPSLAADTAWFAPLPPGKYSTALPATVSPTCGCRSAVATTSMLMLPATKTRPILSSIRPLCFRRERHLDHFDVGQCRQAGLVAEVLDLEGGGGAREYEMVMPAFAGVAQIGIDIRAVEDVAGAVGV